MPAEPLNANPKRRVVPEDTLAPFRKLVVLQLISIVPSSSSPRISWYVPIDAGSSQEDSKRYAGPADDTNEAGRSVVIQNAPLGCKLGYYGCKLGY